MSDGRVRAEVVISHPGRTRGEIVEVEEGDPLLAVGYLRRLPSADPAVAVELAPEPVAPAGPAVRRRRGKTGDNGGDGGASQGTD